MGTNERRRAISGWNGPWPGSKRAGRNAATHPRRGPCLRVSSCSARRASMTGCFPDLRPPPAGGATHGFGFVHFVTRQPGQFQNGRAKGPNTSQPRASPWVWSLDIFSLSSVCRATPLADNSRCVRIGNCPTGFTAPSSNSARGVPKFCSIRNTKLAMGRRSAIPDGLDGAGPPVGK